MPRKSRTKAVLALCEAVVFPCRLKFLNFELLTSKVLLIEGARSGVSRGWPNLMVGSSAQVYGRIGRTVKHSKYLR